MKCDKMLEPIYYDIGRICKETYCNNATENIKSPKYQNMTPKIIDEKLLKSIKSIKSGLLKVPFDCPDAVANYLIEWNVKNGYNYGKIKYNNDCEINYLIVNFGKYVDKLYTIYNYNTALKDNTINKNGNNDNNNACLNIDYNICLNIDLAIISDGRRIIKRKEIIGLIPKLRNMIPPNSAIYFPTALPWEIPLLVYLGVDYFDYSSAYYYASLNYKFTKNRLIKLNNDCSFDSLLKYNMTVLDNILEEVRYCIMQGGCLRNLVEETTLSDPYLRSAYKRYMPDLRNIPLSKGKKIMVTIDETTVPEVRKYIERVKNYEPFTNTIVLLPCSSKKPYSYSKSHQFFINAINSVNFPVEELVITSPYGIVPRALEGVVNYDIPVTGKWSLDEIEFINSLLKEYLDNAKNKFGDLNIIAHLPEHYLDILDENKYSKYGNYITTTKDDGNPTSIESLKNLKNVLEKLKLESKSKKVQKSYKAYKLHKYKELAKFQFNKNFIPDDVVIKGKHKKFFIRKNDKLVQICSLNEDTGLFVLTYDGGKLLGKTNWVEVNFNVKKGSLFAPGFKNCDENISVNDEVVVIYNDEIVGVGRAFMSGFEMKKAKHGALINIRHVKSSE